VSARLAIGTAAVLASASALTRRSPGGSRWVDLQRSFDAMEEAESRLEAAHAWLAERGGRPAPDGEVGMFGPPPLQHVILTALVDEDGDPGVWIHWIEGTKGQPGAWDLLRQALEAGGVTFAAGETIWERTFQGWMRHGFREISAQKAEDLYHESGRDPDLNTDPANRYFMVYL
jgi:hypothetical protein